MAKYLFEPAPNETAIDFLRAKRPLAVNAFKQLLPELQAHAMVVSGINNATALQEVRDLVAGVPAGEDYRKTKKRVAEVLGRHLPIEPDLFDDEDAVKKHLAALDRRAEMVVRNNAFQAYSLSAYKELDEFRDLFTHWKYLTVGDGRVRDTHRALNNLVLPNGHPFWRTHFPPWEFGCRCQVVGLTPDEYEEELAADRARPDEERTVLEGALLEQLEQQGTLTRKIGGAPVRINVQSERERGIEGAWRWEPEDLALSFAGLESRYDAQVWGMWQAWAKAADAGNGQTVWDWTRRALGGGPALPAPVAAPGVAVAAPVSGASTALGTPVAGKLDPIKSMTKEERTRVEKVLETIDKVHGDGPLPVIPVGHNPGARANGAVQVWQNRATGEVWISKLDYLKSTQGGPHPEMTILHEMGHFIDCMGGQRRPGDRWATDATKAGEPLEAWWKAVTASKSFGEIEGIMGSYYRTRHECWARSYAQFIAEESGDATVLSQLAGMRAGVNPWRQWDTADFAPIRETMRRYFVSLNWMKGTQS